MSTSVTPPLPRQPVGRTFLVAATLLGLFALIQLFAFARHAIPALRAQLLAAREKAQEESVTPQPAPAAAESAPAAQSIPQPAPDPAFIARAAQIVSQADRNYRVGDYEATLRLLEQAEEILPTDPAIQFRIGQAYEGLNDKTQAFLAYERSTTVPGLPLEIRRQAEQKMALLAQALGGAPEAGPGRISVGTEQDTAASGGVAGEPIRDAIGLQPGSSLGIVDTRIEDSRPGIKNLRIAIKSRPNAKVDPQMMGVSVYFYEKEDTGEIVVTEGKSQTQWISPPIDWKNGEPEILDVEYPTPDGGQPGNSAEFGAMGRVYYGYMVGVYYNGELQDSRSNPGSLDQKFPLPLIQKTNSNE